MSASQHIAKPRLLPFTPLPALSQFHRLLSTLNRSKTPNSSFELIIQVRRRASSLSLARLCGVDKLASAGKALGPPCAAN
jgi:hypothetical protein